MRFHGDLLLNNAPLLIRFRPNSNQLTFNTSLILPLVPSIRVGGGSFLGFFSGGNNAEMLPLSRSQ